MSNQSQFIINPNLVKCNPKMYPGKKNITNQNVKRYLLMYCLGMAQNNQLLIILLIIDSFQQSLYLWNVNFAFVV